MRANGNKTGCVCKANTYDVFKFGALQCDGVDSTAMGELQCMPCLSCLECSEQGGALTLKPGYALYGQRTIFACPVSDGCIGATVLNLTSARLAWVAKDDSYFDEKTMKNQCARGYAGPVCGKCDRGYNHLRVGKPCDACDDGVINVPLVIGLFFGLLIIGGVFISGAITHLEDHGMITDIRLLIGFYQLLGQMDNILNVTYAVHCTLDRTLHGPEAYIAAHSLFPFRSMCVCACACVCLPACDAVFAIACRFPEPVPTMLGFLDLLFLDLRNVVRLDCWDIGGFIGKLITNTAVMPSVFVAICILIYMAQKRTVGVVIAAGAADESAYSTVLIKLESNLLVMQRSIIFTALPCLAGFTSDFWLTLPCC